MELFLILVQIAVLSLIVVQDFKHREVFWVLFPALFLCNTLIVIKFMDSSSILFNFLINGSIIFIHLIVLTLYFSIKNNKLTWIVNKYLGIGDVLMFLVMSVLFSPVFFIIYIITSLFGGLIFGVFARILKLKSVSIPLAGFLSLVFVPVSLIELFTPGYTIISRFSESLLFYL